LVNYLPDHLSSTFAALSDPTRRAILARLSQGDLSVKELAEPFPITAPSIPKHLKVLERAGLIHRSRIAQRRPCHLESAPLREVAEWVAQYRRSWEHSMNRLDEYLGKLEAEGGKKHARRKKR
jgi:DNA-binding transcriptional ArsR family regulator